MCDLAAHTARNLKPIIEVMRKELKDTRTILEVGSGNGQHATAICSSLPQLTWQTSDRYCNHDAIHSWLASAGVINVKPPLVLDVLEDSIPESRYDAVFSANTAHIMSMQAVQKMFELTNAVLQMDGVFCLYGPFRQHGRFNSDSNSKFHESLQAKNPTMGIRHLEALDDLSLANNLRRVGLYAMPANNMLVVWGRNQEEVH